MALRAFSTLLHLLMKEAERFEKNGERWRWKGKEVGKGGGKVTTYECKALKPKTSRAFLQAPGKQNGRVKCRTLHSTVSNKRTQGS